MKTMSAIVPNMSHRKDSRKGVGFFRAISRFAACKPPFWTHGFELTVITKQARQPKIHPALNMVFSDPAPAMVTCPAPDVLALQSAMSTLQPFWDIYAGKVIDYTNLAQVQAILSDPTAIPTAKSQIAPINPAQSATEAFCLFTEAQDPVSADPRADASQTSPASILETVTKLSALLAPGCLTDLIPFTTAACTNGKRLMFMALRRCLGYNQCGPFGPPIRTGAVGTVTSAATENLADAFVKMWQSTSPAAFVVMAGQQQANQQANQQQQDNLQQQNPQPLGT